MRTGPAAGRSGYFHEAILYGSAMELLDVAVPFLREGLAAGEPSVLGFGEANTRLVRDALPASADVRFLEGGAMYARPASTIAAYRKMLARYVADGAKQIRIIGEFSPAAFGRAWGWWARYESAINELYDDFPLWSMCAYDRHATPVHVLDDVVRTHPTTATAVDCRSWNSAYVPPAAFLSTGPQSSPPDPLQRNPPVLTMIGASPAEVRQGVETANTVGLPSESVDHLKIAVNEVVTNAMQHGEPPIEVRFWSGAGRMVVSIANKGGGPTDPFAGLRPAPHAPDGGLGLWLVHQLCDFVRLDRADGGFTVTLTAGDINASQ